MPYVDRQARMRLAGLVPRGNLAGVTPGELNYIITRTVWSWLTESGGEVNYTAYNAAIGVLENVKLELYRRKVARYEDQKQDENGEVYC